MYFAVNNSGWMASYVKAGVTAGASYDSSTSNVGAALKAGYVSTPRRRAPPSTTRST
ncbi:hypothetical protein [Streptomyces collinus]